MSIAVHHVVEGPPDRPVIVLSHAIGTDLSIWDAQVAALAPAWRVVRYDHRGHGASPVPTGPYSIADLGADLLALLDRLEVARASICGISLGAMTALWVAANAPDRVDRVVACAAIARPASPAAWAERAATVRTGGVEAVAGLVVERWGYAEQERKAELAALVRRLLLATPDEGYAGACGAVEHLDLWPELARIVAPTLLVVGEDDPAASLAEAQAIAEVIPATSICLVPDAAHLMSVEQPDAVTAAITEHLAPLLDGGNR
jgi:3-oxoadipate enol-lactonase